MMKIIIFIGLITCCWSCVSEDSVDDPRKRNENWCWFVDKETGIGEWIPVSDRNNTPDGKFTLFHCNGDISMKGSICDNELCDTAFAYGFDNKLVTTKVILKDTTLEFWNDGKYTLYGSECSVFQEGEYKEGKPVGMHAEYYENGVVKMQRNYYNDTMMSEAYYPSGARRNKGILVKGMIDGELTKWFESGNVKIISNYKREKLDGSHQEFYEDGQLESITNWSNGKKEGPCIFYHENGKVQSTQTYIDDKTEGVVEVFYESGQLKAEEFYRKNVKEQEGKYYYPNGQLDCIQNYINGISNGEERHYYKNGQLRQVGNVVDGKYTDYKKYDRERNLIEEKVKEN